MNHRWSIRVISLASDLCCHVFFVAVDDKCTAFCNRKIQVLSQKDRIAGAFTDFKYTDLYCETLLLKIQTETRSTQLIPQLTQYRYHSKIEGPMNV